MAFPRCGHRLVFRARRRAVDRDQSAARRPAADDRAMLQHRAEDRASDQQPAPKPTRAFCWSRVPESMTLSGSAASLTTHDPRLFVRTVPKGAEDAIEVRHLHIL